MDFKQLFETQRKLDERIIKEKGLKGTDLLEEKILSLRAELGELSNEWRGFKYWSENQEPRTKIEHLCPNCSGKGKGYFSGEEWTGKMELCTTCDGIGKIGESNPMLEEYVDCLHFLLSIGNECGFSTYTALKPTGLNHTTLHQFNEVYGDVESFKNCMSMDVIGSYEMLFNDFLNLSRLLGFTDEQIEQAYYVKNETNHNRQSSGY